MEGEDRHPVAGTNENTQHFAFDDELFDPAQSQRLRQIVYARVFEDAPDEAVRIGRYRLLERLGAGGMGVVYAAYDEELDRKVALKLLRRQSVEGDDTANTRLLREAKALARLSHPNVVQVHDVGRWEGRVFVTMEFVRGRTLRQWLQEEEREVEEILRMFQSIGRGLVAAHEAGVVHRDFKPDNVVVSDDGRPRVLDFGLAAPSLEWVSTAAGVAADDDDPSRTITQTGLVIGTPAYMAPEQFEGTAVDERADQFSFGVALWEALHGERPFAGKTSKELQQAVSSQALRSPAEPGRVSVGVDAALRRALQTDPSQRHPKLQALLGELGPTAQPGRNKARQLRGLGLGALILALGGAAGAAWIDHAREREHQRLEDEHRQAEARAERDRRDAVWLTEASGWVGRDPTRAIATLLRLSEAGWQRPRASDLLADAASRGVARRLIEIPDDVTMARPVVGGWVGKGEVWEPLSGERTSLLGERTRIVSPNGSAVWSVAEEPDEQIRLVRWSASDGLAAIASFDQYPALVLPSADAKSVAAIVGDRWQVLRGDQLVFTAPRQAVDDSRAVALAPDAAHIALLDERDRLRLRNLQTGTEVGVPGKIDHVQFSPDGRFVMTQSEGAIEVRPFDEPAAIVWRAETDGGYERPLFSPDGRFLAAIEERPSNGAGVGVWSVEDGATVEVSVPTADANLASGIAFSPNSDCLLAQRVEGSTSVWSMSQRRTFATTGPRSDEATFSGRDCELLTRHPREVRVWSTFEGPAPLLGAEAPLAALASAGHGGWISAHSDGSTLVWNERTVVHRTMAKGFSLGTPTSAVAGSPDGTTAWRDDGSIVVRHPDGSTRSLSAAADEAYVFAMSPSGRHIAWVTRDAVWEVDLSHPGAAPVELKPWDPARGYGQLLYSSENTLWLVPMFGSPTAWYGRDRGQAFYEVETSEPNPWGVKYVDGQFIGMRMQMQPKRAQLDLRREPAGPSQSHDVDPSTFPDLAPSGEVIFTQSGAVRAWDPETDHERTLFRVPDAYVTALDVSPDGVLAVGDFRGRIWILEDLSPLLGLEARTHAASLTDFRLPEG